MRRSRRYWETRYFLIRKTELYFDFVSDRITEINDNNGTYNKGSLKAELDIKNTVNIY